MVAGLVRTGVEPDGDSNDGSGGSASWRRRKRRGAVGGRSERAAPDDRRRARVGWRGCRRRRHGRNENCDRRSGTGRTSKAEPAERSTAGAGRGWRPSQGSFAIKFDYRFDTMNTFTPERRAFETTGKIWCCWRTSSRTCRQHSDRCRDPKMPTGTGMVHRRIPNRRPRSIRRIHAHRRRLTHLALSAATSRIRSWTPRSQS